MSKIKLRLALECKASRNLILNTARGEQKEFFPVEDSIRMWIKMLETHLMFEQWLTKDEHQIQQLQHAKTKVKELMSLTKYVGKRTKGRQPVIACQGTPERARGTTVRQPAHLCLAWGFHYVFLGMFLLLM